MEKNYFKYWLLFLISVLNVINVLGQTSIEQKLVIFSNSCLNGGEFVVDYKIKGSNLTSAKTLGSLNADLVYDSSIIRFNSATNWNASLSQTNGYEKFVSNNEELGFNRSLRIMVNALNVNADSSNSQQGYNLENEYAMVLRLNFIILDNSKSVSIVFKSTTNQIGLFTNPGNNPNTFEISDHILSNPIVIENASLPVTLTNFNYTVNSNNVTLKWVTSSEQNNSGFKIERKQLNVENSNWYEAGFIKGKGNSNTNSQYTFEDNKLSAGKYNYRIKQLDNNGNYKYFSLNNIVEIGIPSKYNLSQNYPNPFNPTTKINYELPNDSKVNITVFDILGREVLSLVNQDQKAGYYTITTDAKNLASGTYFYRLIAKSSVKDYVISKKMCVIK
jgi:hypothetical protein